MGEDAYIKGANKLKNLTVNSGAEGKSQIGEGCELVNGIMGFGCRAFYGVKAVRFIMASHSQLKYGARLINSYLGNNATISCCEVLNSLIFPAHEQHHNNSFLCASLVMGQSNIAAGATIGSNHNSRSADGELIAGRGFWPGLCVSLKHNSKFASFTMIAKGDYPAELSIPLPFSLISNDVSKDRLVVMPGYWFMYNMYALQRNSSKYVDRDKRKDKTQHIEYDYLAPDSVNELFTALELLKKFTGKAFLLRENIGAIESDDACLKVGMELLEKRDPVIKELTIVAEGFENTNRPTIIIKVLEAYHLFKELITYYGTTHLLKALNKTDTAAIDSVRNLSVKITRNNWLNMGGQLMPITEVEELKKRIKNGKISSWKMTHDFYRSQKEKYNRQVLDHAMASLKELTGLNIKKASKEEISNLLDQAVATRVWMTKGILTSRAKDYSNTFRKMAYDDEAEMNEVVGKLEDNAFIIEQNVELKKFRKMIVQVKKKL